MIWTNPSKASTFLDQVEWKMDQADLIVWRNIYAEASKADDVEFALALIEKIRDEIPQADMENVNIAGQSLISSLRGVNT